MRASRGSITPVSRGVYRVQATRGRDPLTGKRRRLDRTVRGTMVDAKRALDEMTLELGVPAPRSDLTVKSYLVDTWLPWQRARVRERTGDGYESKVRLYIVPTLGREKLADLDAYALDKWLDRLRDDDVSAHTRLHAFRVLRTAMRRAVKWSLIPADPTAKVDTPKARIPAPDVLTATEAGEYVNAARGTALAPVVALALGGGLRRSELCALTWKDVDLKAGTVTISSGRHQQGRRVWSEPTKSATSARVVVLPEWAIALMKRGVGRVTAEPEKVSRQYRAWAKASKLTKIVPLRCLRHTSATLALESGADIALVSRRLGHSQIGVTVRHYIASGVVADATVAAGLDTILSGHLGTSRGKQTEPQQVRRHDK